MSTLSLYTEKLESATYDDTISVMIENAEYEGFMAGNIQSSGRRPTKQQTIQQQLRQAKVLSQALRDGSSTLNKRGDSDAVHFRSIN